MSTAPDGKEALVGRRRLAMDQYLDNSGDFLGVGRQYYACWLQVGTLDTAVGADRSLVCIVVWKSDSAAI